MLQVAVRLGDLNICQRGFHSPTLMLKQQDAFEVFLEIHPISGNFHHFPSIFFQPFPNHFPSIFTTMSENFREFLYFPAFSQHFPRCSARFGVRPNGCRTHPGGPQCRTRPHRGDGAGTGLGEGPGIRSADGIFLATGKSMGKSM